MDGGAVVINLKAGLLLELSAACCSSLLPFDLQGTKLRALLAQGNGPSSPWAQALLQRFEAEP